MATLTVFPDPHPETTSVDGATGRRSVDEAWATIRAGGGNYSGDAETSNVIVAEVTSHTTLNNWQNIIRSIYLFDTSALGANVNISSGTFSFFVVSKDDSFSQSISLVNSTPASNTSLADSDYGNVGTTQQATDVTIASITASAYNTWSLNATGLASISKTGITKFGLRTSGDRTNTEPTWVSAAESRINGNLADTAGTGSDPKLEITYTAVVLPPQAIII